MKRKYGHGTVCFESARNKYKVAIVAPDGHRITKRFDTEADADAWRIATLHEINIGEYIPVQATTFGEWLTQYLGLFVQPKVREKTFVSYLVVAAHISADFAGKNLQKITTIDAQRFLTSLDVSASMRKRVAKLLARASKKAYIIGSIRKDFMLGVEIPTPEQKPIEIFTLDEIPKIFAAINESPVLRRHYPLVALALASGARMGEMLALTPDDIYTDAIVINKALVEIQGKVSLQPPKTQAGYRRITLPAYIISMLQQLASLRQHDQFLFLNTHGNPCCSSNVGRAWRTIIKHAGIPYRKFHCLRHTHATMMLAAHVPVLEVAKRLGHSKASHTLNLYGHAIPGYDKNLPKLVDEIFQIGSENSAGHVVNLPSFPQLFSNSVPTVFPKR